MNLHRVVPVATMAIVGTSLTLLSTAPSAQAVPDVTTALGLPAGVTAAVSGSGAVSAKAFDDFPSEGADYYVLSTGTADAVFPGTPDADAQLSTDRGNDGAPDSSTLTLTIAPSTAAGCLFVDFAMGTEEPVHTYTYSAANPGDSISITKRGDASEYATNAGWGYFSQASRPAAPRPYTANAVDYWHHPGDPSDPIPGTAEEPWLPEATPLNSFTSRDTARVPLDLSGGGGAVIDIRVADSTNGDLDTVALLDRVRLGATCAAGTGVEPNPVHQGGVIAGLRGVGNALVYDPVPSTDVIEGYDGTGNGWRSPSGPTVPVELRFRWYRTTSGNALVGDMARWEAIPDADRQAYVPTAGDYGKVLICLVTGVVDGRRYETFPSTGESATWYVTTKIASGTFVDGEAPVIVGPSGRPAAVGDTLSAQIGHTVPREDSWTWRWYANGVRIIGATAQTLTLSAAQAGKTITVEASAQRLNFDDKAWESASYGPVQLQEWTATGTPTIVADGEPTYGTTLVVDPGTDWVPTPDRYSYQWKRNGSVISNATYASYTIRTDDVGDELSVVVSGVKTGLSPAPRESAAVTVVSGTMTGSTPTISGTPRVGERLAGNVADWDPVGTTLTYEWFAGPTLVQEGSTFLTVTAEMMGQPIVLKVTGRRSGYTTLTKESTPTAAVTPGVLRVGTPTFSGLFKTGNTVHVSRGSWGPSGVRFSYRWKVGGKAVTGVRGAGDSFVIPRSALGKRLTVTVTGRLEGYGSAKSTTAPSEKVRR